MTLPNTPPKEIKNGNDVTTVFFFSFIINQASDLTVIHTDADGVETTLVEGTGTSNYSVSLDSVPGAGSITYPATLGTELPTGETLTLSRQVDLNQESSFKNQTDYNPNKVEQAIDYSRMVDQQQQEVLDRSFTFPISYGGGASSEIPAPVPNGFLAWNAAGDALETVGNSPTQWLGSNGSVAAPYYSFATDPDTGLFRITSGRLLYSKNGVSAGELAAESNTLTMTNKTLTAPSINGVVGGVATSQTITTLTTTNVDGALGANAPADATVQALTATGDIILGASGANADITKPSGDKAIIISGGMTPTSGANLVLRGPTDPSGNNDLLVRSGSTTRAKFDGTSGEMFSANGIRFGTDAAANLIDDTEFGTFTATLSSGASTAPTKTWKYVKIGDNVTIYPNGAAWPSVTFDGSEIIISGLPFVNSGTYRTYIAAGAMSRVDFTPTSAQFWRLPISSTSFNLKEYAANSSTLTAVVTESVVTAAALAPPSFSYTVD